MRKAILLVHGFAGGVYDFENLSHELERKKYDVFTFTLPGHDGDFREKITYKSWINKSEEEIEYLITKGYKKIYLIGHSMGGVIASYLASKYPQVKKLVLAAPAFEYFGYDNGRINYSNLFHKSQEIVKQYGLKLSLNRTFKLPFYCISELKKIVNYHDTPSKIKVPTLLIWGTSDNIVPKESIDYVYKNLKTKKGIIYVKDSTHNLFKEDVNNKLSNEIIKFLNYHFIYDFSTKNIEK